MFRFWKFKKKKEGGGEEKEKVQVERLKAMSHLKNLKYFFKIWLK